MSTHRLAVKVAGFLAWAVSHDLRYFARTAASRTAPAPHVPTSFELSAARARELLETLDDIRALPEVTR